MRGNSRWVVLLCACAAAMALVWPADAYAQRRVRVYRARPAVVISAGYFWPSYGYWPAYGPYYWGWYPPPFGYYPPYYSYRDNFSSARVQVTPKDAQVYVDGYFAGMVDDFDGFTQRLRLEPGEHQIQLYREGYRSITDKLLFRPGETYRIRYVMEPLAPGEPDEPRPQPQPGARPRQPARDYPPPGPRTPRQAPEYPPAPPRTGPEYPPPDRGDPNSTFGTLSIRVQPPDATIVVDGERWEGPQGGSRLLIQVPEGTHRVEIHKDGYKDFVRTVDVRRGEVATLNVSLGSEERP